MMLQSKDKLRDHYRLVRSSVSDRQTCSDIICRRILQSESFRQAELILAYYPCKDEVSVLAAAEQAILSGKTVAFPFCHNNKGDMSFYVVACLEQLKPGRFGIPEPDISECPLVSNTENSLMLVPGLAFALSGYRLGYGKGFYDRYISSFNGVAAGVCYEECIATELPFDKYDKKVSYLFTQKSEYTII